MGVKTIKGGKLEDDATVSSLGLTNVRDFQPNLSFNILPSNAQGQTIMLMGTAGELPKEPPKPTVFVEDLNEHQIDQLVKVRSSLSSFFDKGNTTYLFVIIFKENTA
jgi:ubiquitin carboxyl-terminal hydrolase 14